MSLFDSIRPLIQICQFSGLTPFSMNHRTSKWELNSALIVLSLVIIAGNSALLFCGIIFNDSFIDYSRPKIRILLLAFLLFLNQAHAMFALLELFLNRNKQVDLLNTFEHINNLFKQNLNMSVDYAKLKGKCRRIILVWICEIFGLLIADILDYVETKEHRKIPYFLIFISSYILCKLSYAYTMILVSLTHEHIDVLNRYLKSVTKQNGYYICETFSNRNNFKRKSVNIGNVGLSIKSLLILKNIYWRVWEASISIENLTYWSLPVGSFNDFFVLLFNSYWFFSSIFFRALPLSTLLLLSILIASNLGNMYFIALNCNKASRTVSFAARKSKFLSINENYNLCIFRCLFFYQMSIESQSISQTLISNY